MRPIIRAFFVLEPLVELGELCELGEDKWGGRGPWEEEEICGGNGGGRFVTRAKRARSGFKGGQGREERRPMPRWGVVATMRVRGGRGWRGGIVVVVVVGVEGGILWCGFVGGRVQVRRDGWSALDI